MIAENRIKTFLLSCKWYEVYGFLEIYVSFLPEKDKEDRQKTINLVLEQEKTGYRMIGNVIGPNVGQQEIKELETACTTPFDSVNTHMKKALEAYGDREKTDYENTIKESISAVEAMCCNICGMTGNVTLGQVLNKLQENGVHIHPALIKGFGNIWGSHVVSAERCASVTSA